MKSALGLFDRRTARWFRDALGSPTPVQESAWPAIASGAHTLVSAPTGTGKTLAAFLVSIDRLMAQAREGTLEDKLHLIYVSPLRSLATDIRENLRRPLDGIEGIGGTDRTDETAQTGGSEGVCGTDSGDRTGRSGNAVRTPQGLTPRLPNPLRIGLRTGDTPQSERRRMLKKPPHILITTPESLFLMLTAKSARAMLATARCVIIDELHALIDSKRGAHLMLSIARLDTICPKPLQRVGLSATIRPLPKAAEYLSPEPVIIAAPQMEKQMEITINSVGPGPQDGEKDPIWRGIAGAVHTLCQEPGCRSALAFVDSRAYTERLAHYVNQAGGEGFARTHHGSMSREQRHETEAALRRGTLRLLCATSSMELGIDVGEIDQVFQVGRPFTVSSAMQRLGRAGHNPNRVSLMRIFPRVPSEALYSGLVAEAVKRGGVEEVKPPRMCLDVLAQHLVSMAAGGSYGVGEVMEVLARAFPFREVTPEDVRGVLRMLAGDYEHRRDIPVRPRLLYDRVNDRVSGDAYSRMLAVSAGGTIPDKGLFAAKTESGIKIGELDEEFVFEARIGDSFLLGSFGWRIVDIGKDTVTVSPASPGGAKPPFWKGEVKGRRSETGRLFGELLRDLGRAHENGSLLQRLSAMGLDSRASTEVEEFLERQLASTGCLPDDSVLVVEHFRDETGTYQMMVHSVFGRSVNEPLAVLAADAARRALGVNIAYVADDDGFLLYPYDDSPLPEGLLHALSPDKAGEILDAALPSTPLFNMAFRYNAGRALMMGVRNARRQPLWVQRLRSAEMLDSVIGHRDHPLVIETRRECLEDYWDLPGVERLLLQVRAGTLRVLEMHLDWPSPMSLPLRHRTEAAMMYDYFPTPPGLHVSSQTALSLAGSETTDGGADSRSRGALLDRELLAPDTKYLARLAESKPRVRSPDELHSRLMIEGDLTPEEVDTRYSVDLPVVKSAAAGVDEPSVTNSVVVKWLETLRMSGRVRFTAPGFFVPAEYADEYESAFLGRDEAVRKQIARRYLRYQGGQDAAGVALRYRWTRDEAEKVLQALCGEGLVVKHKGLYHHAAVFEKAVSATVRARRALAKTWPAEAYAAFMMRRVRGYGRPEQALEHWLDQMRGAYYPADMWEQLILPARVPGYRPEHLDALLAKGTVFWRLLPNGTLGFHPQEDADWNAALPGPDEHDQLGDPGDPADSLSDGERVVLDALVRRGASFIQGLEVSLGGLSPHEHLLSLAAKGLARADSFVPVRQILNQNKMRGASAAQRSRFRVMTLLAGRWEAARPLKEETVEEKIERSFKRTLILSRETIQGISWADAARTLRLWEYSGRVRRGYFVEGLSGIQYIKDADYGAVAHEMDRRDDDILWLAAVDPAQVWGRFLPHREERSFTAVPGTVVAFKGGAPMVAFERQGKTFRVFGCPSAEPCLGEALRLFVEDYQSRRLYPSVRRLTVKEYPPGAEASLTDAGFHREMQDFVMYRQYR